MTAAARRWLRAPRLPRAWLASLRVRVVARHVVLLALATTGSILVARQLIAAQIDERIEAALTQEVEELERLRREDDPAAGQPPGERVRDLFDLYLERNVASRGEAFLTFVGGRPYRRSPR